MRLGVLALIGLTACARPILTKDGKVVFAEPGARGAAVMTANGLEFHDVEDLPTPVVQRDPADPWRSPIGFILPKSGVFTNTSTPLTLATKGALVVVRSSDTRVPSWGGEVLVRVDVHALATTSAAARAPERVSLVVDGSDEAMLELVHVALAQLGAKDTVSVIDVRGAKLLVPEVPATHRALALAATATRLAKDRPRALTASIARAHKLLSAHKPQSTESSPGPTTGTAPTGRLVVLSKEAKNTPDAGALAALEAARVAGLSVGTFDPGATDAETKLRKFVPASGPVTFAEAALRFSGVPAPTHVLEATSGESVWTLEGGDLMLGALHAGETRTEIVRVTVPPWGKGSAFKLRVEAVFLDAGGTQLLNVGGTLSATYDDDIEKIADSRHGDVIAYASALATMHRLTAAFAGDSVEAHGGLLTLARLHTESLVRMSKDFPDRGFTEDAAVLTSLLSSAE